MVIDDRTTSRSNCRVPGTDEHVAVSCIDPRPGHRRARSPADAVQIRAQTQPRIVSSNRRCAGCIRTRFIDSDPQNLKTEPHLLLQLWDLDFLKDGTTAPSKTRMSSAERDFWATVCHTVRPMLSVHVCCGQTAV